MKKELEFNVVVYVCFNKCHLINIPKTISSVTIPSVEIILVNDQIRIKQSYHYLPECVYFGKECLYFSSTMYL